MSMTTPYHDQPPQVPRVLSQTRRARLAAETGLAPDHPGIRAVHEAEKAVWQLGSQLSMNARHGLDSEQVDPHDLFGWTSSPYAKPRRKAAGGGKR